jgi:ribosomal-protein-alanine N-acetyltransferase
MVILETERLLMRRLVASDLDDLSALYRDPEIRRYFAEGTLTLDETLEELEWFLNGHPDHPELGLWATIHKPTGQFIGRCGLLPWTIDGVDEVEIAYLIAKPWQRQGLGAEAARALVRYGFETLGLKRLVDRSGACGVDQNGGEGRATVRKRGRDRRTTEPGLRG